MPDDAAPRTWRPTGRAVLAAAATTAALVLLTDLLRRTVRASGVPAVTWNPLEPWLPTLMAAHAGYTVAPWPTLLRTGAVLTAVLVVVTVCLWSARLPSRRAAFVSVWAGALAAAVIAVGAHQAGEVVLRIQEFGGRGGSYIRTFTIPALWEALRWGALWGWLPALVYARVRGHVAGDATLSRRRVVALGALAFLAAAAAGVLLAWAAQGAAISARTEVA